MFSSAVCVDCSVLESGSSTLIPLGDDLMLLYEMEV